jgi:transcriptional regulator GlxA family with amidase domain
MAQTLLKTTTLSILQVSDQVGYPDSNNFSSVSINYHPGITDKTHNPRQAKNTHYDDCRD